MCQGMKAGSTGGQEHSSTSLSWFFHAEMHLMNPPTQAGWITVSGQPQTELTGPPAGWQQIHSFVLVPSQFASGPGDELEVHS